MGLGLCGSGCTQCLGQGSEPTGFVRDVQFLD
jgi:hypothetical protein